MIKLFYIDKRAPLMSLLKVAKDMIQLSMPIKCLEAVILAIHLTNEVPSMDRFTLTFKSQQNGLIYYHTVLGLFYRGRYGAIGLSRKDDLMSRPIEYEDLSAMLLSFNEAYMNGGLNRVLWFFDDYVNPHKKASQPQAVKGFDWRYHTS